MARPLTIASIAVFALGCNTPTNNGPIGFTQSGSEDCQVRASVSTDRSKTDAPRVDTLAAKGGGNCDPEAFSFYFARSDASVGPRGQAKAEALAECLNRAPFATRRVVLVGHADTRSNAAESPTVAGRRSRALGRLLARAGVDAGRIETRTADEALDRCGAPELRERRVTVQFATDG